MITADLEKQLEDLTKEGNFLEAARIMLFRQYEYKNPRTRQFYEAAIQKELDRGEARYAAQIAFEAKLYTRASELYDAAGNPEMSKFSKKLQPLQREYGRDGN